MDEKKAIGILRKHIKDEPAFKKILKHSDSVKKIAIDIAKDIRNNGHDVDIEFIKGAALLHDIGRAKLPPGSKDGIRHGIIGGKILRTEGYIKEARVAERHIGVGITKEDIEKQNLNLPKKDYVPITIEEKIIAYADNLEHKNKIRDINYVLKRFEKEVSKEYTEKIKDLHNELERLKGGKNFI